MNSHIVCRCIKEWDLRKNFSISNSDAVPKVTITYPGVSKRRLGKYCINGPECLLVFYLFGSLLNFDKKISNQRSLLYFDKKMASFCNFSGYSNLVFDSSYSQLFANCRDDVIYQFDVINNSPKPGKICIQQSQFQF